MVKVSQNRGKIDRGGYTRPAGAGNFDNMDDNNIVRSINIKFGTTQETQDRFDSIVNKKYLDDNTFWQRVGTVLSPKTSGDLLDMETSNIVNIGAMTFNGIGYISPFTGSADILAIDTDVSEGNRIALRSTNFDTISIIDNLKVYGDIEVPTINGDATQDLELFGLADVGDADAGKVLKIHRKAAEGDTRLQFGINKDMNALCFSQNTPNFFFYNSSGAFNIQHTAAGDFSLFANSAAGKNASFNQAGYITAAGDEVEISWTVKDTDDYFWLERESADILGLKIDMPLDLVDNNITTTGEIDTSYLEVNQLADSKAIKVNGFDDVSGSSAQFAVSAGGNGFFQASGGFDVLTQGGSITLDPSANCNIFLPDTSGTFKFKIFDSDINEVASIDSDGNADFTSGDITTTGGVTAGASTFGDGGTTNYTEIKADGEINLHGTARVLRDNWIPADALRAGGTSPANFTIIGLSGAWRFADNAEDEIIANIKFPNDMDMSVAPTFSIGWSTNDTNENDVEFKLEYLYTKLGDDTSAAAQDTDTSTDTAVAQADGLNIMTKTIDVPEATDVCIHLRLTRLAKAGSNDTIADNVDVHGICFQYTSNKLGVAT